MALESEEILTIVAEAGKPVVDFTRRLKYSLKLESECRTINPI